jgi:hypothetical protein
LGITNLDSTLAAAECGIRFHSKGNARFTGSTRLGQPNPGNGGTGLPGAFTFGPDLNDAVTPL